MEEEVQKKNSDCVYFIASPLTCKEGSKCEFRHSERARLNPRDCYYWKNGNCINPTCAFRHPPLEGATETGSEPAHPTSNAVIPTTTKSSVPCYFYFNAYCIKGDNCPFLHDIVPAQMNLRAPPQITTINPPEMKASTGSDTGPASVEVPANPIKQEHLQDASLQPATGIALEEPGPSAESSVPENEEHPIKLSDESPLPHTGYGSPQVCLDQGSEEFVKECAEPDEWWESSPGFDVLVDDGSDHLPYDDDPDYMLARERESEMLQENGHLLHYDYEAGYDPLGYPDAGFMYEHGIYDGYDRAEYNRYTPEYFQREQSRERSHSLEPRYSREKSGDFMPHRQRKPSRRRRDVVDLRDQLRKRRRTDGSPHKQLSSCSRGGSRERPVKRGMDPLHHGARLVSEDEDIAYKSTMNDSRQSGWSGYPRSNRHAQSRIRERESRRRNRNRPSQRISAEVSERTKSSQVNTDPATFNGPKTLAQIKEEKRRAAATEGNNVSGNFEGPKPLNELIKDKKESRSAPSKYEKNGFASLVEKTDVL